MNVDGQLFHLVSSGQGRPPVIFEAGISASSLNWTDIRCRVSEFTSAVSYDRASLGWSDPARTPRLPSRIVEELHRLLGAANIPGPYILVGHSFGGLLVRAYAASYPDEIAGLVLIDPLRAGDWLKPSQQQLRMLRRGVRLSRRGALLARLGVVRFALSLLSGGARRLPQFIARLSSGEGESMISRIVGEVRKMPPETWPMIRAHWSEPKSFVGLSSYLQSLPASCAEFVSLGQPLDVPVTILSAANATPAELDDRAEIVRASSHGKHIIAGQSGHWIHLDQPELVLQAIRDMVDAAR